MDNEKDRKEKPLGGEKGKDGRSRSSRRRRGARHRHRKTRPEAADSPESQDRKQQSKANMIVLVDDDPAYVEMESLAVVHYLTGFNPMGFTQPSRALNYITNPRNASRIRLVLLDLEMPRVDGHTVQEILQILKQSRDIPVAIVSAHNTAENIERIQNLGAVGFLPKAFTMEVFVRFVKEVLRNGHLNGWQCAACGRLLTGDLVDMLTMRPIKCSSSGCGSSDIRQAFFGSQQDAADSGQS
ncbi:MAG: response regulator [Candidatus Glassbacteria bacterium]|nr:response regulator [Candidatus Glassbacteria bacterium]